MAIFANLCVSSYYVSLLLSVENEALHVFTLGHDVGRANLVVPEQRLLAEVVSSAQMANFLLVLA